MKKINIFNRNINSPSYRRRPVSGGIVENRHTAEARCPGIAIAMTCPAGDFSSQGDEKHNVCDASFCIRKNWIPAFAGMTMIAIAALFATPSFAEPTELDKKTVASKAYVDTKQDIIETGLVNYYSILDEETKQVPSLVSYDLTNGLVGNEIGILDWFNTDNEEWRNLTSSEMDNFVPTVRAVAGELARKQDLIPAAWTSPTSIYYTASTGGQTIDLTTTRGIVGRRYITAGGSQPLTQKTGADNVILYINGTKTLAQYQTSNFGATGNTATTNQNYIKGALVSLELLKDVYSALHNEIQNATPTGTPGNVAMYDATTGALGDGVATYDGSTTYNASTDADKIAVMSGVQRKKECGGYEPGHENDPDYCWLWIFPD
ncbi:MAG: hypothetical protein IJL21_02695 [Alphaproteobacteria bacterium]|nr:hypothetical protein [Alphaproteobacteria bacterium]